MAPLSGGNGDFFPENAGFVEISGVFFLHAHRTAAAPDVTRQPQQLLHMDQLHVLIPSGLSRFFQVQLAAHGDAEHIDSGPFPAGHQGLKHLFRREAQAFRRVDAPEVLLVIFIEMFPAGDTRLFHQAYRIGFSSHLITKSIIQYPVNIRKRIDRVKLGYPKRKNLGGTYER